MSKMKSVLVVGSGVSGLTTALALLREGHDVTIWSRERQGEFPASSLNAYAMWVPIRIDADTRIERWADMSLEAFNQLAANPETGVTRRPIFVLRQEREEPWYADKLSTFRHAEASELSDEYEDAWVQESAPVIDPMLYLPWLHSQVLSFGGRFEQRVVKRFQDIPASYDAIVNCTSLGTRALNGDDGIYPVRMQVLKLKHNGFDRVVIDDDGPNQRSCIVPHNDYIKLGAVFTDHSEDLTVDDNATRGIIERCNRMVPGFNADLFDVLSVTCAVRPERSLPRVELEHLPDERPLVHNYGHDGMGYVISFGIAAEIMGYLAD